MHTYLGLPDVLGSPLPSRPRLPSTAAACPSAWHVLGPDAAPTCSEDELVSWLLDDPLAASLSYAASASMRAPHGPCAGHAPDHGLQYAVDELDQAGWRQAAQGVVRCVWSCTQAPTVSAGARALQGTPTAGHAHPAETCPRVVCTATDTIVKPYVTHRHPSTPRGSAGQHRPALSDIGRGSAPRAAPAAPASRCQPWRTRQIRSSPRQHTRSQRCAQCGSMPARCPSALSIG